jgi:hypothetical protein
MKNSILQVLLSPDAFFENALREKESLKIPAFIVLAGAFVAAAYGYMVGGPVSALMAGAMPSIGSIVLLFAVIGPFVATFLFWAIWSALIYGISVVFKGTGTFKRTLEFVGYGYIPQIIGTVITLVVALEYIPRVVVPHISFDPNDPNSGQILQDAMKSLMHDPAMMQFTQISTVISIIFLLWSANIWIFGAKHSRQLTLRNAAICVALPALIFITYTVYGMAVM